MSTPNGMEWVAVMAASHAAFELGLVRALHDAPGTAAQLAARVGADARALGRVRDMLAAVDIVERTGETYALARAIRDHLDAQPTGFANGVRVFEHVTAFARTGEPLARMDGTTQQRADAYTDVVGGLAAAWADAARDVARALAPVAGTILDVGAGSGVWSLALAELSPDARVIAIDFPAVLARFRERAVAIGIADRTRTIEGSWFETVWPRADLAILANVLHLEEAPGARRLLGRACEIAPRVAIIDVLDGPDPAARRRHAAYQLHLAARTRAGTAHGRAALTRWLDELGYAIEREIPARVETTSLTCLVASRRPR